MSSVYSMSARIRHAFLVVVCVVAGLLSSPRLFAQTPTSTPEIDTEFNAPANVSVVEGRVTIDRDDEVVTAAVGEPIVDGDRLTTDSGRAEIWFADGSALAVDERSTIELLSETLLRVTSGRVYLTVARATGESQRERADDGYRIDLPTGSLVIDEPGEYSISLTRSLTRTASQDALDDAEVAVIRGSASFHTDNGSHSLRSGERLVARADGVSYPERFNAARLDGFERWAVSLHAPRRTRATSTQYLPSNLRMYSSAFDQYGAWEYEPTHGYVWYPGVADGWRPYYQGFWRPLPRYGWTWIAADRWGWPTHHYGRWGYGRSRWFWIPDRRWGPAWVSWASAADYVSWCPLGFNNRPVFNFSLSVGNTWAGWVVLPRRSFGLRNAWASHYAYDGRRIPRSTAFAVHARAPIAAPAFRSHASQRVDNRFERDDRWTGRDRGRRADGVAGPRASRSRREWATGDREPAFGGARGGSRDGGARASRRFAPRTDNGTPGASPPRFSNRDLRDRGDAGWRAPWPNSAVPQSDGNARRRGSDRWYGSRPAPDDRPTPQNPRAGVWVDPGVPRAGDRLNPSADRPRYRTWSDRAPVGEAVPRDRSWQRDAPFTRGSLPPPVRVSPPPNPITPPPNPITPSPGAMAVPRRFGESRSYGDGGGVRGGGPVGRPFTGDGGRPDGGPGRAVPRGEAPSSRGSDGPRSDGPPAGDGGARRRGAR